jgi:hypothetical protein
MSDPLREQEPPKAEFLLSRQKRLQHHRLRRQKQRTAPVRAPNSQSPRERGAILSHQPHSRLESVLSNSPFLTSSLPPDQLQAQTRAFLAMFSAAVQAESDPEEEWAYGKMRDAYTILAGKPPTDPARGMPAGMWEAMNWAADLTVVRDLSDQASQ